VESTEPNDVLWGVPAIAEAIFGPDRSIGDYSPHQRRVRHLIKEKRIPAKKIGQIWVASRSKLRAIFSGEDAA